MSQLFHKAINATSGIIPIPAYNSRRQVLPSLEDLYPGGAGMIYYYADADGGWQIKDDNGNTCGHYEVTE
jgi:hypothetical protein